MCLIWEELSESDHAKPSRITMITSHRRGANYERDRLLYYPVLDSPIKCERSEDMFVHILLQHTTKFPSVLFLT